MDPSLETIKTPYLKKLFSPSPTKENVHSNDIHSLEEEKKPYDSQQPNILPLAEALEYAQKYGLPKQRRILLPSSKRKSSLRTNKVARETIHLTTEEAIQATIERIGPRRHRILSLIASRDPMDTITSEDFWKPESQVDDNEQEQSSDTRSNHSTSTPPVLHSTGIQNTVQSDEMDYPWVKQVDGYTSTTTPCTVQVDFDVPQTTENDDLSFSYEMVANDEDEIYLQQDIHDHPKHAYKIQHVAGLTVDCDSKGTSSHPSKRPKGINSPSKNKQSLETRKTENRRGQPRELRFLPTSREDDGLRQIGSGVRRSQRTRFPVLKFWKNETILYERRDSRQFPTIAGILAYPDTPQEERRSQRRRRRGKHYSRTTSSGMAMSNKYPNDTETSKSSSEEQSHHSMLPSIHSQAHG
ncbi:uncharacterized protein Gasu_59930 [Galdieria sulphuraria]|uniref:Uncharacterized protein n=1 Tax=Galdieria sulphuraria TaxID=130081 RepID=M2WRF2_GALSU|nr:uncharacterized protein Gasu_59930 [Galdieria sulphuraria]EME26375.1 hypothetical protein Gasu_59930 [Galdieria sulphuraria]|eukprot:XP_005702895.1 hypothetical protein Gasu_59930 [Galdieria sulphuraria]